MIKVQPYIYTVQYVYSNSGIMTEVDHDRGGEMRLKYRLISMLYNMCTAPQV